MVASEKEKSELGAGMAYLRQATFSENDTCLSGIGR